MARNRRKQRNPLVIQDWIDKGRSKDRNGNYKPWLRIQDLASLGRSQRLTSHLTGERIVHLMSDHEAHAFFFFELDPNTVDICEQYPLLPLGATQQIARELTVDHPADDETGLPTSQDSRLGFNK